MAFLISFGYRCRRLLTGSCKMTEFEFLYGAGGWKHVFRVGGLVLSGGSENVLLSSIPVCSSSWQSLPFDILAAFSSQLHLHGAMIFVFGIVSLPLLKAHPSEGFRDQRIQYQYRKLMAKSYIKFPGVGTRSLCVGMRLELDT